MLGFRGAARYVHPAYAAGFALECAALRRVRGEMGLTNVRVMVPFCRRVEEARRVLETMAGHVNQFDMIRRLHSLWGIPAESLIQPTTRKRRAKRTVAKAA